MAPSRKRRRISEDGTGYNIPEDQKELNESEKTQADSGQISHRRTIFVRSLPADTTTEKLLAFFSQSFPVKHATAVTDPATKLCKGFGFVTFADPEDAGQAIQEFNGKDFEGRRLRVEIAEPRHRDEEHGDTRLNGSGTTGKPTKVKGLGSDPSTAPPRLIIRNLPWSIKEPDELAKIFTSYGKVKTAVLPKKKNGIMSGFGFVLLRGRKNAEKAIADLNGREIEGRTIAVDWAVDKNTWEHRKIAPEDELEAENEEATNKDSIENIDENSDDLDNQEDQSLLNDGDQSDDIASEHDINEDAESAVDGVTATRQQSDNSSTLFLRNLPFSCTDEALYDHFSQFGRLRYARVVLDSTTERSRGTGFVSFVSKSDATACLRNAPRQPNPHINSTSPSEAQSTPSVLQNDFSDLSGDYTMDGRVLHVTQAVDKAEAKRFASQSEASRHQKRDNRRLYLLSEGTISSNSPLYQHLAPSEVKMREASVKQRQKLIESNPTLHLSLTRLSVRNIPRTVTSKDLKALAREAVVGFATDVKKGVRQPLSKEELERGGEEMRAAEQHRRTKGKGLVKQAKIVFEGREGSKVSESSGAGRSRGYGFIEYYTHRSALMGLRWLNGHSIAYRVSEAQGRQTTNQDAQDRKKRLIVEFAIENVQVVGRRKDRESKARERATLPDQNKATANTATRQNRNPAKVEDRKEDRQSKKRQRANGDETGSVKQDAQQAIRPDNPTAKRQNIIARKRLARKQRKNAAKS
ncbi:MAG: RNA recognition motif-containing protein [Bathelium mastoideum]|nr:MAG: RNA recognition motif-containing protein [Bathelium mastoideum]